LEQMSLTDEGIQIDSREEQWKKANFPSFETRETASNATTERVSQL
jgi:hypothetical protein